MSLSGQFLQSGFFALQIYRPKRVIKVEKRVHLSLGTIFCNSNSILVGLVWEVNPNLFVTLLKCVSTIIAGFL